MWFLKKLCLVLFLGLAGVLLLIGGTVFGFSVSIWVISHPYSGYVTEKEHVPPQELHDTLKTLPDSAPIKYRLYTPEHWRIRFLNFQGKVETIFVTKERHDSCQLDGIIRFSAQAGDALTPPKSVFIIEESDTSTLEDGLPAHVT